MKWFYSFLLCLFMVSCEKDVVKGEDTITTPEEVKIIYNDFMDAWFKYLKSNNDILFFKSENIKFPEEINNYVQLIDGYLKNKVISIKDIRQMTMAYQKAKFKEQLHIRVMATPCYDTLRKELIHNEEEYGICLLAGGGLWGWAVCSAYYIHQNNVAESEYRECIDKTY